MRYVLFAAILALSACGYDYQKQQDAEEKKNDEKIDSSKMAEGQEAGSSGGGTNTHVEINNKVIVNGSVTSVNGEKSSDNERVCDAPFEFLIDSKKQTWEEAGVNAPEGFRLIKRHEFVKAYDAGAFKDYEHTYTVYWTGTQNLQEPYNPVAVNLGSSSHQTYGYSTKLAALYISTCDAVEE